jgi:ribosomal protein S27E
MAGEEFNTCKVCGIGKMRPTGGAATSADPETNRVTDDYREYKCDNCGNPQGGKARVLQVDEQVEMGESTSTTTSSPAATATAQEAGAEAVEEAAEEEEEEDATENSNRNNVKDDDDDEDDSRGSNNNDMMPTASNTSSPS